MNLREDVQAIALSLQKWASKNQVHLTMFEALQIATQIQRNKLYLDSHFRDADAALSNLDGIEDSLKEIASALGDIADKE